MELRHALMPFLSFGKKWAWLGVLAIAEACATADSISTVATRKLTPGETAKHSIAVEVPTLLTAALEQGTFTCLLSNIPGAPPSFRVTFTAPASFTTQSLIDPRGWKRTVDSAEEVRVEKSSSDRSMFLSFSGAAGVFNQAVGGFEGPC